MRALASSVDALYGLLAVGALGLHSGMAPGYACNASSRCTCHCPQEYCDGVSSKVVNAAVAIIRAGAAHWAYRMRPRSHLDEKT